jgi:hypothetical protein
MRPSVVLQVLTKNADPPASEWHEWTGEVKPGHYYAEDIPSVRLDLHGQGVCPTVQLSGVGTQKAWRVETKAGDVVIHRRPPEAFVCQDFAEIYEKRTGRRLVYQGESLASLANKAFEGLLKPPGERKQLSEEQREHLWISQGRACALCGWQVPREYQEVDHRGDLFMGGVDAIANLQILCAGCHGDKTTCDGLSFVEEGNPLLSRFSLETYEAFVKSPKPPQIVATLNEKNDPAISIDVIKCRCNAFVHADGSDVPVFSSMDSPAQAVPGELADFMYVDIGKLKSRQSERTVLPYWGAGWYGRAAVAFLLDAQIIEWCHATQALNATARRPMRYIAERKCWSPCGSRPGVASAGLRISRAGASMKRSQRRLRSSPACPLSASGRVERSGAIGWTRAAVRWTSESKERCGLARRPAPRWIAEGLASTSISSRGSWCRRWPLCARFTSIALRWSA